MAVVVKAQRRIQMKKQDLLKPRDAARALGIRLDAIYPLIWAGRLEAVKQDGRWLIPASAIESRLRAREVKNG